MRAGLVTLLTSKKMSKLRFHFFHRQDTVEVSLVSNFWMLEAPGLSIFFRRNCFQSVSRTFPRTTFPLFTFVPSCCCLQSFCQFLPIHTRIQSVSVFKRFALKSAVDLPRSPNVITGTAREFPISFREKTVSTIWFNSLYFSNFQNILSPSSVLPVIIQM